MEKFTVERIAAGLRGVRFPAELGEILGWSAYNSADRQTRRELCSLPWRTYQNIGDVIDQIIRTRRTPGARSETDSARPTEGRGITHESASHDEPNPIPPRDRCHI
jgi:hypothetical protein